MTTPSYRLIQPPTYCSFVLKYEPFDLTTRWHYHPEIELIYFIEGRTSCVIGDTFKEFVAGDLVILGANFPHVLQESRMASPSDSEQTPFGLIIQFTENFLGEEFMQRPELQPVHQMLQRAHRGLQFDPHNSMTCSAISVLRNMPQQPNTQRLLSLLNALTVLAESQAYHYLTHQDYQNDRSADEARMQQVYELVYNHFSEKISVDDAASIANMTPTSFCRYFKSRTLKTFTHFLNEVRVAYACKLLRDKNGTVTNACFSSGFGSMSYFNRRFKAVMQMTPQQYKQQIEVRT